MKKFRYELIPSKKDYPEYIYDKTDLESIIIPQVFHDTYTEKIISDWYENSERRITVGEDLELDIELKIRKQSVEIAITPTGTIDKDLAQEPKEPELTTIWVGGVRRELKGKETARYQIEYNMDPIKIRIEKEFYEPAEFEIEVPSEEDKYAYEIQRKTGEWRDKSREEVIEFEEKTEEDKSLRDEESFVKVKGINGTKLFEWTEEYIDNKRTGAKTKESSTIAKEPVTEIFVKGTMVVEWKKEVYKTEPIAFDKKTVEDNMVLPENSGITTKGQDGVRTYYREYEYENDEKSGQWRNETSKVTKVPVTEIYTKGIMVVEWKRELYKTEAIPFEVETIENSSIPESQSYVKTKGVAGTLTIYREFEYVNGKKSNEWRNEEKERTKEPVIEVKVLGTAKVEWKKELYTTNVLPFKVTEQKDKTILPKDSYVKTKGVNGSEEVYREYEWFNGEKTGEWRNETVKRIKDPVDEVKIVGTMAVEWKKELYTTNAIPFKVVEQKDNTILPKDGYVKTKGVNGSEEVYREFEYVNGDKTDDWRNETTERVKEPVDEVKIIGTMVVEWKKELYTTNIIPFETETTTDKNVLPADSYIKTKGVAGEEKVYREYKYVNGSKTTDWRNETKTITKNPTTEVRVEGTMVLEWRKMSRDEIIPITTRYEDDPNLEEGKTRTVAGTSGVRLHEWEEEFRNGVSTGKKRYETSRVTRAMIQRVVYTGTKAEEGLLLDGRGFFSGSHSNPYLYALKSNLSTFSQGLVGKNRILTYKGKEFIVDITSYDEKASAYDIYFEGETLREFLEREDLMYTADAIKIYDDYDGYDAVHLGKQYFRESGYIRLDPTSREFRDLDLDLIKTRKIKLDNLVYDVTVKMQSSRSYDIILIDYQPGTITEMYPDITLYMDRS